MTRKELARAIAARIMRTVKDLVAPLNEDGLAELIEEELRRYKIDLP